MEINITILILCAIILAALLILIIVCARRGQEFQQLESSAEHWKKVAEATQEDVDDYSSAVAEAIKEASEERLKKQEALSNLEKMTKRAVLAESGLQAVTICRDADQHRGDAPKEPPQQNLEGRIRKHPHDVKYPGTINMECESAVRQKLKLRCLMGRAKYGHTMERDDLSQDDWVLHAQEEAMDLCVYLERLLKEIRGARRSLASKS